MSEQNKKLCLDLLYSESEDEVIKHLKAAGFWNDPSVWRYYGDNENNWAQIGIQQAHPVAAMIEKLVNSIDAVLMRECLERGIHEESADAPQSIPEALERFYGIKKGNLANIGASQRGKLAKQIGFIATGEKGGRKRSPNYTVFDCGEGQTPNDMPETLLSLSKSNKLRIPFVQGKFNMGGTGVLRHGGKNRLQLIVSRRCPGIADTSDPTSSRWGFTIVRRQEPANGARSSVFTYLAPNSNILMFDGVDLGMPQGAQNGNMAPRISWGTAIKLYEYKMKGLMTNIKLDPYYVMSLMLPKPGLPIRFYEFRSYKQESPEATMAGLLVRLEDDRAGNVEGGFPVNYPLRVSGEKLNVDIFAFTKDSEDKRYRKNAGVVFTVNGQAHGTLQKAFFSRRSVRMDYLRDSLLVIVDASDISPSAREDLFMNSRDRLSEGDLRNAIEAELEKIVSDDPMLKELRHRRRAEALDAKLGENKPLNDLLQNIVGKYKTLESLLIMGRAISNPHKIVYANTKSKPYKGIDPPTYFQLQAQHHKQNKRPINRNRVRFQFDTDAVDNYFSREISRGIFELDCNGQSVDDYTGPHLLNGVATVNISLPDWVRVGDNLSFEAVVDGELQLEPFCVPFRFEVTEPDEPSKGKRGKRQPPAGKGSGNRKRPDNLAMPKITEVYKDQWHERGFDKYSALSAVNAGDNSYDYFVNMDNDYLSTELNLLKASGEPRIVKTRFKMAMVLLGMAVQAKAARDESDKDPAKQLPSDVVEQITSLIAPVILPMIDSLGDLEID